MVLFNLVSKLRHILISWLVHNDTEEINEIYLVFCK